MKIRGIILAALFGSVAIASGRSMKFALMTDILTLGRLTKIYHDETGTYPTTWQQFEERLGPAHKIGGVLEPHERFTFVGTPIYLPAYPTEERILLISREPFRPPTEETVPLLGIYYKTVGDRVYVAIVQQGDNVFIRKITPERASKVFGEAGAELPKPSGLGLYPHESAHQAQTIALWLGAISSCVAGLWAIVVRKSRRSEQFAAGNRL